MGQFGRVLSVVAVIIALVGAYNVYASDPNLEGLARQKSCDAGQKTCRSRLLRLRRSPISQVYVFAVGGYEVEVDCTRSFLLFGPHECKRQQRVELRAPGDTRR